MDLLKLAVGVVALSAVLSSQERLDLTVAEQPPSNASYAVASLQLDWERGYIHINLKGANGERKTCLYGPNSSPSAESLMVALNKANLSTRSLNQRIFDRLIVDGCVVGTVAGSVP